MKVLVTGSAGFVGSNLAEELCWQNHEVYGVDNFITGKRENLNNQILFFEEDLKTFISNIKFDVIFHIAALARIPPSLKDPRLYLENNLLSTISVLEMARKNNSKVIYAGSSSFYFDPYANPYANSKYVGEEICKMYNKTYGISVAIARFYNVYGRRHVRTGDNACAIGTWENQKINNLPLTITGDGSQRRDWTNVSDIVNGLILISKGNWNGDVFDLGRGENKSVKEVVDWFNPKEINFLPKVQGEAKETLCVNNNAREILGWNPTVNLKDYVEGFLKENNL